MSDQAKTRLDAAFMAEMDQRFRQPLMRYFQRRLREPGLAEDCTQQVFLRLAAAGARGTAELDHADRYVFTVAANVLKDRAAKEAQRRQAFDVGAPEHLVETAMAAIAEDRSPERVLLGRERLADVLRSLDELGDRTRDVFVLFRLERMRQREIAELLGLGLSTVEKHVIRATLHLTRKYGAF